MAGSFPDSSSEEEENHNAAESVPSDAQTDQEPISYSRPSTYPSMAGGWQSSESSASDDGDVTSGVDVGSGDVRAGSGSTGDSGTEAESHTPIENIQTSDDRVTDTIDSPTLGARFKTDDTPHASDSHLETSGSSSRSGHTDSGKTQSVNTGSETETVTPTGTESAAEDHTLTPPASAYSNGVNSPTPYTRGSDAHSSGYSSESGRNSNSSASSNTEEPYPQSPMQRRVYSSRFGSDSLRPAPLNLDRHRRHSDTPSGTVTATGSIRDTIYTPAPQSSSFSSMSDPSARPAGLFAKRRHSAPEISADLQSTPGQCGPTYTERSDGSQMPSPGAIESSAMVWRGVNWGAQSRDNESAEVSPGGSLASPRSGGRRAESDASPSSTEEESAVPDSLQDVDWSERRGGIWPSGRGRGSSAETAIRHSITPEQTATSDSDAFDAASIALPSSPTPPHTLISISSAGQTVDQPSSPSSSAPIAPLPRSNSSGSSTSSVLDSVTNARSDNISPVSSVDSDTIRHSIFGALSDSGRTEIDSTMPQHRPSGVGTTSCTASAPYFKRSPISVEMQSSDMTNNLAAFTLLSNMDLSLNPPCSRCEVISDDGSAHSHSVQTGQRHETSSTVSSQSSLGSDDIDSYAPTDSSDLDTHPSSPTSTGFRKSDNTGDQLETSSDGTDSIKFDNVNVNTSWVSDDSAQSSPAGRGSMSGQLTSFSAASKSFFHRHTTNPSRRRYPIDSLNQGTGDDSSSSAESSNSFIPSRSMSSRHFGEIKARATDHLTSLFTRKDNHQDETEFDSLCGRSDDDPSTAEISNPYSNPSARTGSSRHLGELRGRFVAPFKSVLSQTSASHQQDNILFDSLMEYSAGDVSLTGPAPSMSSRYIDKARNKVTAASTSLFGNYHTNNNNHDDQSSRLVSGITEASSRIFDKIKSRAHLSPKVVDYSTVAADDGAQWRNRVYR